MRVALPAAAAVAAVLVLAGCGGSSTNNGGMPTPAAGDSSTGGTEPTGKPTEPRSTPTTTSSGPAKTAAPEAKVIVVPGNYGDEPAVQGLMAKYPIYFQALIDRDDKVIKETFPAFFYLDVTNSIKLARSSGWVMRPPASVVVMGTVKRPHGVVRVNLCASQRTQYWNPKAKKWAKSAPKGLPEAIDMVKTGTGWSMYRKLRPDKPYSCAAARFPA